MDYLPPPSSRLIVDGRDARATNPICCSSTSHISRITRLKSYRLLLYRRNDGLTPPPLRFKEIVMNVKRGYIVGINGTYHIPRDAPDTLKDFFFHFLRRLRRWILHANHSYCLPYNSVTLTPSASAIAIIKSLEQPSPRSISSIRPGEIPSITESCHCVNPRSCRTRRIS